MSRDLHFVLANQKPETRKWPKNAYFGEFDPFNDLLGQSHKYKMWSE